MSLRSDVRPVLAIAAGLVATAACDDQVKYVSWFETMTTQPSVETYEAQPMAPVEGTVPAGSARHLDLLAADTLLSTPLEGSPEDLERGVVGPNRLPPLPTLNLLSERALDLSDGYIYGMIANGRGVMPSYRRVQHEDRWYLVEYVRKLQEEAPAAPVAE
jgi:hypothetical protein